MNKKYEIKRNKTDDYVLKYKDKEFSFKTDINLMSKMQKTIKNSRIKMITELAQQGLSVKDLVIEKKSNGKTLLDNSNKVELEQAYLNEETANVFNDICKEKFNMDLTSLISDIELETEEEIEKFSEELTRALTGKNPSSIT